MNWKNLLGGSAGGLTGGITNSQENLLEEQYRAYRAALQPGQPIPNHELLKAYAQSQAEAMTTEDTKSKSDPEVDNAIDEQIKKLKERGIA